MDCARRSRRGLVFLGPGQLSQEPADHLIGLDLISSVGFSEVTACAELGRGAEPLPPRFLVQTT
jgi:hypothetical protein